MAVILDTNAVSALFVGDPALGKLLSGEPMHHLPVIVIGEYRYGLLQSRDRQEFGDLLNALMRESIILPVDEETAEVYSELRGNLRQSGRPIPENDLWIAALARQHGQPVVSRDGHFDHVPGLRRVAW